MSTEEAPKPCFHPRARLQVCVDEEEFRALYPAKIDKQRGITQTFEEPPSRKWNVLERLKRLGGIFCEYLCE